MLLEQITEILDPEPHAAPLNMAIDEALLRHVKGPTLRIYHWLQPAVSFGYFGQYEAAHDLAAGRELVRRWTGGGEVEHGADLTYTFIVPRGAAFFEHAPLESYRLIHEQIAAWLAEIGVAASVAPSAARGISGACFDGYVLHDLVAEAGKVAGAAQRRTRWGLLHQGSIQLPFSAHGSDFISAGMCLLAKFFAKKVRQTGITPEVQRDARHFAHERYATDDWLRKF